MKQLNHKFSKSIFAIIAMLLTNGAYAATDAATTSSDFKFEPNTILIACAILLLIVIIALGNTLRSTVLYYNEKRKKESKSSNSGKILSLILVGLLFASFPAIAQDATSAEPAGPSTMSEAEVTRWILLLVIGIEILVIFTFTKLIKFFATGESEMQAAKSKPWFNIDLEGIWNRMNKFQSIDEEASIDTGHSYDGIRELNNVTPPWFIAGFILSIIFAIVYMWRYHVVESAPLQIEEYNISVIEAKTKLDEYLKTQANNVDENTVVMLDADGISAGQALFAINCVACHGDKGQGAAVGPNLADNYWIHKGGIADVFKSIKYGWQEKGMKSWKDDFSSVQMAQLSSYIMSLKGTNPAGAKEAQGELFTEEVLAPAAPTEVDSTKK